MPGYFPRHTIEQRAIEPRSIRKITVSLLEMGIITGIAVRLLRAIALTMGSGDLLFLGVMFALIAIVLLGMLAFHLSNFTLRRWVWRAPAFAAVEAATEVCVSAVLIALHWEPRGTQRAEFQDWPAMAVQTFWVRLGVVILFAGLLAGVVTFVRRLLVSRARDREAREELQEELYRETPI